MKVSVIVPVYDTEKYLIKCLDSIVGQTLEDIEIIAINDGSTDHSLNILHEYEKKDARVIVVDIPNGGVSNARNLGIEKAKGEYFICIDSDDYIAPTMLEILYKEAVENGCELTACNMAHMKDGTIEQALFNLPSEKIIYVKKDSCRFICDVLGEKISIGGSMGTKLYKTDFVKKTGIRFEERSEIYAEDAYFNFKMLKHIEKIGFVNQSLYYYYKRENSVSNTYKENFEERIENFINGLCNYYTGFPSVQNSLKARTLTLFVELLQNLRMKMPNYKKFKRIMKHELFINNLCNIDVSPYSKKQQYIYKLYVKRKFFSLYLGITFSVRETGMVRELFKRKILIFLFAFLICAGFLGYNFISTYFQTSMRLSLNYEGIEKGLNPDGSKFNIFEIVSPIVLDKAIEKIGLPGITVDYLRDRVDVYSVGTFNSSTKAKNAIINGKNYTNFANAYTISYSQKNKFSKNNVPKVLKGISEAYTEVFMQKYTNKNSVLQVNMNDLEQSDYLFSAEQLESKLSAMIKYLQENKTENSTFVSQETGKNFDGIINMLQNMNSTEVAKYKAYIVNSAVSKNRDELLSMLQYQNNMLNIDYNKKVEENRIVQDMITKYDTRVTRVVFVPSLDSSKQFYMSRTKTGIDYLTQNASDTAAASESILQHIKFNEYLIDIYKNSQFTDAQKTQNAQNADSMLKNIENNLNEILKVAIATDSEYRLYQSKNYLTFSIPKDKFYNHISISAALLYFVLGAAFITFLMIIEMKADEVYTKYKERQKEKPDRI